MKAQCATQATATGQRNTTVLCPEHLEFFDRSDKQGRGQAWLGEDNISDYPHLCTMATSLDLEALRDCRCRQGHPTVAS